MIIMKRTDTSHIGTFRKIIIRRSFGPTFKKMEKTSLFISFEHTVTSMVGKIRGGTILLIIYKSLWSPEERKKEEMSQQEM